MSIMRNLRSFPFGENDIRLLPDEAKPMFVANDVAQALGYKDVRHAIQTHCKHGAVSEENIPDRLGRSQFPVIIPESDVYRLIFRSRLPSAEAFADWVFEEVLPSIRKTGGYSLEEMTEHGRVVRDRTLFEVTSRTTKIENELRNEIKELRRELAESAVAT